MAEPGWRTAWVARLSWLSGYEKLPVMARTRPVLFKHDHRSLHHRPYAQVGTCASLPAAVGNAGQNHIIERELALCGSIVDREWQNPPVGQSDTPRLALIAGRFLQDDGGGPVHVIK